MKNSKDLPISTPFLVKLVFYSTEELDAARASGVAEDAVSVTIP